MQPSLEGTLRGKERSERSLSSYDVPSAMMTSVIWPPWRINRGATTQMVRAYEKVYNQHEQNSMVGVH